MSREFRELWGPLIASVLILTTLAALATYVAGCVPPTGKSSRSLEVDKHLDSTHDGLVARGLTLLAPYDVDPAGPGRNVMHDPGWPEISQPSAQLLYEMSNAFALVSISTQALRDACDPGVPGPVPDYCCTRPPCCNPYWGDCDNDPQYWPEDCDHLGESGVYCGDIDDLISYLECCGECGCSSFGCAYICVPTEDCPEDDHPVADRYPYIAP